MGLLLGLAVPLAIQRLQLQNRAVTQQVAFELLAAHPKITAEGRVATLTGTDRGLGDTVRSCQFTWVAMTSNWICATHDNTLGGAVFGSALELKRVPSNSATWIVSRHLGINFVGIRSWSSDWEIDRISAPKP